MTGEITLRGKVLPIGGLKEKSLAARRVGIKDVIIPKANEKDIADIPKEVRSDIIFHPVTTVEEVFSLAFFVADKPKTKRKKAEKTPLVIKEKSEELPNVRC